MDTGLCGLELCLFGGDLPEDGVQPLTVIISFDIGEQVASGGLAANVMRLVDEFGFQGMEPALHRRIIPAIALSAHRCHHPIGLEQLAVVAGGRGRAA